MADESPSGKLAVILHADVADSTRMVQQDEHLSHERIHDAFRRLSSAINEYSGRVLETRGDALLAEFDRPSDAVTAALSFQTNHSDFLSTIADELKPEVRVGIAMGEVVVADNTVTGAGVVMAQRVEQIADAGGICITSTVKELLPKRLPVDFGNLGEQTLKGFDDQIRVFSVRLAGGEPVPPPRPPHRTKVSRPLGSRIVVATIAASVIAAAVVFWGGYLEQPADPDTIEIGALPLPDKPSIAVLSFDDLSPETPTRSVADGLTETLISTLGQVDDLFVIARNSVMTYKGRATDVREIGRQLGVQYVLEGSVQQSPDKVRVTAQLVDTSTGGHLWSERYDRPFDDIFYLQDEIALKVLVSLQVHLTDGEVARLRSSTTKSVDAYLLYQRGVDTFFTFTEEAMTETRQLMDEALELDPDFTSAMILKAWTHVNDVDSGYSDSPRVSFSMAEAELAHMENRGLELTALARGEALMIRGFIQLLSGNHDSAIQFGEQSVKLLPNHPDMLAIFGSFLRFGGESGKAIELFHRAMRVDPGYKSWFAYALSETLVLTDNYSAAETAAHDAIERARKEGDFSLASAHLRMAIVQVAQGNIDPGKAQIQHALKLAPWLSLRYYRASSYYRYESDLERMIDALRRAGLAD